MTQRRDPRFEGDWRQWPDWVLNAWWDDHARCRKHSTYGYKQRDQDCYQRHLKQQHERGASTLRRPVVIP